LATVLVEGKPRIAVFQKHGNVGPVKTEDVQRRLSAIKNTGNKEKYVNEIISVLFPESADENSCLRLRRICHPQFFDLYFTLSYLHATSPQVTSENLIVKINISGPDEQKKLITDFLVQSDFEVAIFNFSMLRLFEADLLVKNVVAVIGSICDALYKCSFQDISDTNRIQNIGSDLVSKLVSRLATDKEATDVLVSVIRNSTRCGFCIPAKSPGEIG